MAKPQQQVVITIGHMSLLLPDDAGAAKLSRRVWDYLERRAA